MRILLESTLLGVCLMFVHKVFIETLFICDKTPMIQSWRTSYTKHRLMIDIALIFTGMIANMGLVLSKADQVKCVNGYLCRSVPGRRGKTVVCSPIKGQL